MSGINRKKRNKIGEKEQKNAHIPKRIAQRNRMKTNQRNEERKESELVSKKEYKTKIICMVTYKVFIVKRSHRFHVHLVGANVRW